MLATGKMPVPQLMDFLETNKRFVPQLMGFLETNKRFVPQLMGFLGTGKMPVPQLMGFLAQLTQNCCKLRRRWKGALLIPSPQRFCWKLNNKVCRRGLLKISARN